MTDARTPETYFRSSEQRKQEALTHIRERLDDLLLRLRQLKEEKTTTPVHEQIVEDEITKLEMKRYRQQSLENALNVVDASISASSQKFIESIEHALEYKVFCRVEPYMVAAGDEIEEQVFYSE